jgi:hypothetical protein
VSIIDAVGHLLTNQALLLGQLGHGDEHDREFPEEVSELSTVGVETVACGNGFCMAFAAAQSE